MNNFSNENFFNFYFKESIHSSFLLNIDIYNTYFWIFSIKIYRINKNKFN